MRPHDEGPQRKNEKYKESIMTGYQQFQLDTYGNILPECINPFATETDPLVKIEQQAELEILNQQ